MHFVIHYTVGTLGLRNTRLAVHSVLEIMYYLHTYQPLLNISLDFNGKFLDVIIFLILIIAK